MEWVQAAVDELTTARNTMKLQADNLKEAHMVGESAMEDARRSSNLAHQAIHEKALLEGELQAANAERNKLLGELRDRDFQLQNGANEAGALRKECGAIEERRADLTAELRQKEIALASAERERADAEITSDRLRATVAERDAHIIKGKEQIHHMENIVAEAERLRTESEVEIDRARQAAAAHGETIERLEKLELDMRGREAERLSATSIAARETKDLSDELHRVRRDLNIERESNIEEKDRLRAELSVLKRELATRSAITKGPEAANEEIEQLKDSLAGVQAEARDAMMMADDLRARLVAADAEIARLRHDSTPVDQLEMQEHMAMTNKVNQDMQMAHSEQVARMSAQLDEAERAHLQEQDTVAKLKMELSAAVHAAELMSKERDEALALHKESRDLLINMKADRDGIVADVTGGRVLPVPSPSPPPGMIPLVSPPRGPPADMHALHMHATHMAHQEARAVEAARREQEDMAAAQAAGHPVPLPRINPQNAAIAADRLKSIQERGQRILLNYRQGP